jgi:hypothetical protein
MTSGNSQLVIVSPDAPSASNQPQEIHEMTSKALLARKKLGSSAAQNETKSDAIMATKVANMWDPK